MTPYKKRGHFCTVLVSEATNADGMASFSSRNAVVSSLYAAVLQLFLLLPCLGQPTCEPLKITVCRQFYRTTIFPNTLNHKSQESAAVEFQQFAPLINLRCSRDIALFLCSAYFPVCPSVLKTAVPPCRSLCDSVKTRSGCEERMRAYGFNPNRLNCDRFPKREEGVCYSGDNDELNGFLLIANLRDVSLVKLGSTDHETIIPDQQNAVGVDFDFDTGFIYWTDKLSRKIQRAPVNNSRNIEMVLDDGLSSPEGLAVDWVNKKLYWTDPGTDVVGVADFDGNSRMNLITSGLTNPRAIVVHPLIGFMFWSDWGTAAKIEKCGMNGDKSTRKVLIDQDIVWPNGMTIDYKEGRLWWTDAKLGTIESADLNGFDRKITLRSWYVGTSFGVAVFGDSIYLTKRSRGRGIVKMDKATGNNWVRMGRKLRAPKELVVYHRLRQPVPRDGNPCQPKAGSTSCSHICLLAPKDSYPDGYSCHCPPGLLLLYDNKTCDTSEREEVKGGRGSTTGTSAPTTPPGPTPLGTEVWRNVRLPDNIVPVHYDVVLYIDLKKLVFFGDVSILVNVTKPTETVLVHFNKMNITSAKVEMASSGGSLSIQKQFEFKENQFYVIVMKSPLEKGRQCHIKMSFRAKLTGDLAGLYKSTYYEKDGKEVTIASTQLQPTDARRTFPCFDEPALKAKFSVTLAHDPSMISISNMPIKKQEMKDEWQLDHFEETPIMPTYLLAFVVCDFKNKTITTKGGTKMSFYAQPDLIDQVDYAMNRGTKMLEYMEDYFGIKYPLPKADMIAIPGFAHGGMENWGLIIYSEATLLYKPGESSESTKKSVAGVVSHELAHQWFGNLVTMEWWNDLWLNEGFARFVEYHGVNATEPNWKVFDRFVIDDLKSALSLDGLTNSHPIKVPVYHPDEIWQIFDTISYNKGASVIRMLQFFLGSDAFLKGLNRYLNKHLYGNAVTDDLWNALEEETCVHPGGCKRVKQMMDTWTLQMGYPVLTFTEKNGSAYTVSQERFLYDRNANVTSKDNSPFNYKWVVPFTYITEANSVPVSKPLSETSVDITWDGSGWLKGNVGQTGFYRINYMQQQWEQLSNQLDTDHQVFQVADRAGLIDDGFNLARAGYIKYTVPLNLTKYMAKEDEYVPLATVNDGISFINSILPKSSPASKYLERYLKHQAMNQYQKLGFTDTGSHLEIYKRKLVLNIMCSGGEPSCLKNASDYFKKWMEDPVQHPVPANFRSLVYFNGIKNGGVNEWNFAFEQFQKTADASERSKILYGLSGASEPWILNRYLQYSIDPTKMNPQETATVIKYVADHNPLGRGLAWQFVKLNWAHLMYKFGGRFFTIQSIILSVTGGFASELELQDLKSFNELKHVGDAGAQTQQQAEEKVLANIQWRKQNEQDIAKWLKDFLVSKNIPLN